MTRLAGISLTFLADAACVISQEREKRFSTHSATDYPAEAEQ